MEIDFLSNWTEINFVPLSVPDYIMEIGRYVRPLVLVGGMVGLALAVSRCPRDYRPANFPKGEEPVASSEYDALVDDISSILKSYKTSIDGDAKTVEDYVDSAIGRNSGEYDRDVREKAKAKVGESAKKEKHDFGRFIDKTKKTVDDEFGAPKPEDRGQKTEDSPEGGK